MNENLYATLFEDKIDIGPYTECKDPDFDIQVRALVPYDDEETAIDTANHGFYGVYVADKNDSECLWHWLADFPTYDDAQNFIAGIDGNNHPRALNDLGRYCYTMWQGLLEIAVRGALGDSNFDPDARMDELRKAGQAAASSMQHPEHGDLSARALRSAANFFAWITSPEKTPGKLAS